MTRTIIQISTDSLNISFAVDFLWLFNNLWARRRREKNDEKIWRRNEKKGNEESMFSIYTFGIPHAIHFDTKYAIGIIGMCAMSCENICKVSSINFQISRLTKCSITHHLFSILFPVSSSRLLLIFQNFLVFRSINQREKIIASTFDTNDLRYGKCRHSLSSDKMRIFFVFLSFLGARGRAVG